VPDEALERWLFLTAHPYRRIKAGRLHLFWRDVGSFVIRVGLRRDWVAVSAGLELPWSNGQTEGQVNRLKLLKRQMYGRAAFAFLRHRFLLSA
jgi:transposase